EALRGAALLSLGLQTEPEVLSRPALTTGTLTSAAPVDGRPPLPHLTDARSLPAATRPAQEDDAPGGQGPAVGPPGAGQQAAPGAGRRRRLVELGLERVRRARADAKQPLPVIANLATWTQNRRPLAQWLAEELEWTYQVPRSVAEYWVEETQVLPLLDGLDE